MSVEPHRYCLDINGLYALYSIDLTLICCILVFFTSSLYMHYPLLVMISAFRCQISDNRFALLKCWKTNIISSSDISPFCDTKAVTIVWVISYTRDTALTIEFRDTKHLLLT